MNLLDMYLKLNYTNMHQLHLSSKIPEATVRSINKKPLNKWTIGQIDNIAHLVRKDKIQVIKELEKIEQTKLFDRDNFIGRYNVENRRYIGSKTKLLPWISKLIKENTEGEIFLDLFAGTGVVVNNLLNNYDEIIINDFLYSNEIIYKAFFSNQKYSETKLLQKQSEFQKITTNKLDDNYLCSNYGGRFFSINDAKIIGEIRERIKQSHDLNEKERAVLIASLLYSADKISNTVGHYDAYRKKITIEDKFQYELINPIETKDKKISIYREDANKLVEKVKADVTFIDPPYNSRQYSRFYHVLEVIAKWEKPELSGVAMKPPTENSSEYSKVNAPVVFDKLISNLETKYIAVTYNNTYKPSSSSSKNKITHEQIIESLNKVGKTKVFDTDHKFFNSGKTVFQDHKEMLFITEVNNYDKY